MANVSDTEKMSKPELSPAGPETERKLPPIEDVRDTISNFLAQMVDAQEVSVTKLVLLDAEKVTWEAEADVYVPNPTIRGLELPMEKEVLDCQKYLLRMDKHLNIVAYGRRDPVRDKDSGEDRYIVVEDRYSMEREDIE